MAIVVTDQASTLCHVSTPTAPIKSVLRLLDVEALRIAARKESRSRQRHLPPVSTYRWWARRTETISGALVDAIAAESGPRLTIGDPFAGGGVIALAALKRGHRVYAQDVNPWAARSLAAMVDLPDLPDLQLAAKRLRESAHDVLERAYSTSLEGGSSGDISHTLRVATANCPNCSRTIRLFPSSLVSLTTRVDAGGTKGFIACPAGHLQFGSAVKTTKCRECGRFARPNVRYTTNRRFCCVECGWGGQLTDLANPGGFSWEVVLTERYHEGQRELGLPTSSEILRASDQLWQPQRDLASLGDGREARTLSRFGMTHWHDLYPSRQRQVIEVLLDACPQASDNDPRVQMALESAIIGTTEMAGLASRWDPRYLKAYEVVANHRFSFTTLAAEPNVWGAGRHGRGTVERRIRQMAEAADWFDRSIGRRLHVEGPIKADSKRRPIRRQTDIRVVEGSSSRLSIDAGSLDAVVTDPPYHDDVSYGELSDIFRAWAGATTGPISGDATVVAGSGEAGTAEYQLQLTKIFSEISRALKPRGHLVLSYANRQPGAWTALFQSLQDSGFKTVGYAVVESENDADHSKVGKRACNLDLLIDLVKQPNPIARKYRPSFSSGTDEEEFCHLIGEVALKIGSLKSRWNLKFDSDLHETSFLKQSSS